MGRISETTPIATGLCHFATVFPAYKVLAIVGLVLNLAGVALLFKFGFPQPQFDEGVSLELEDGTVFDDGTSVRGYTERARITKRRYRRRSGLALLLIMIGVVMQVGATIIAPV